MKLIYASVDFMFETKMLSTFVLRLEQSRI